MRNLVDSPLWQEEDLGLPIPDVRHACSVCMPTWQSVIDYEEGRDKVVRSLKSGYPRFFFHPDVATLFSDAREEYADSGQDVMIYPTREAAQRAQRFLELNDAKAIQIKSFKGTYVLVFLKENFDLAKSYWRYTGEGISSRQAERITQNREVPTPKTDVRVEMAKFFGCESQYLHLWQTGMSAIFAAHRFAIDNRSGKKTLQVDFPYVDSMRTQQSFGSGIVFLVNCKGEDLKIALERIRDREFAAVFTEVPSNPLLTTPQIQQLSEACRASRTPFFIDDTVASHYNVDVLPYADVVTTSCTKWVSGKGDVMAGATRINPESPMADQLEKFFTNDNPTGSTLATLDAEVLVENSKGFVKRMKKVNEAGDAVASFLNDHPAVDKIYYPKFITPEAYAALQTPHGGFGGLLSITLNNEKKAAAVYDALKLTKGPSLGTEFTLACPYTLLAHYDELEWADRHDVSSNLIRFSIGVEQPGYLVDVIGNAIDLA